MQKLILSGVAAFLGLVFIGCSGGGGGSSSTDSSIVSFPTNAVIAEPTLENGEKVEDAVATDQTGGITSLNSVESNSEINMALLASKVTKNMTEYIDDINFDSYALNETINDSINYSVGGTIDYSLNISEDSMTAIVTENNCDFGYAVYNGSYSEYFSGYDAATDDFHNVTIKFLSDYTIVDILTSEYSKIFKNSSFALSTISGGYFNGYDRYSLDLSYIAADGVKTYGLENSKFYFDETGAYLEVYQTQGKVYIDNLNSYVTYDTNYDMSLTPFTFDYIGTLIGGEARYNMSGSGKVKIVVESNEAITYVDADGDGIYELSEND